MTPNNATRTCIKCQEPKTVDQFRVHRFGGLTKTCKQCIGRKQVASQRLFTQFLIDNDLPTSCGRKLKDHK